MFGTSAGPLGSGREAPEERCQLLGAAGIPQVMHKDTILRQKRARPTHLYLLGQWKLTP